MRLCRLHKVKLYMTVYLLWVAGCVSKKVHFECGARLDVTDVQGLVLSPGFPYNYSSGTHCVWQFFVPAGNLLTLEMLDFDIFASHSSTVGDPTAPPAVSTETLGDGAEDLGPFTDGLLSKGRGRRAAKEAPPTLVSAMQQDLPASHPWSFRPWAAVQQSVRSRRSWRSTAGSEGGRGNAGSPTTAAEWSEEASAGTQLSPADTCPHDVLYISDLVTFSSRFCGSNRPAGGQLEFGSDAEMVEVIMELITTTHWGRGFALLFFYRNWTQASAAGQRSLAPSDGTVGVLLAAVCGAALFTVAVGCVLCMIYRPKLCSKGSNPSSSISSEVLEQGLERGQRSLGAEGSELQLVAPSCLGQQLNDRHLNLSQTGSAVRIGGDVSQNAELEHSSALKELECSSALEMGMDEVFVISPRASTSTAGNFPHTCERFLRHSNTECRQLSDWPALDSPDVSVVTGGVRVGLARGARAWSVRTFQDLLSPLPQLQKWCSWRSSNPFTSANTEKETELNIQKGSAFSAAKPYDNMRGRDLSDSTLQDQLHGCKPKSSVSSTPYLPASSSRRQRRLWRVGFPGPCFSLFSPASESSKPQGGAYRNATTTCHQHPEPNSASSGQQEMQGQVEGVNAPAEDDHASVPAFAILEEDDRQPLVMAEYRAQPCLERKGYDSPRSSGASAEGALCLPKDPVPLEGRYEWRVWGGTDLADASPTEESKNTSSKTELPSLRQIPELGSVTGWDM